MARKLFIVPGEAGLYAHPFDGHGKVDERRVEIQMAWDRVFTEDGREFARIFDGRFVLIPEVVGGSRERRQRYIDGYENVKKSLESQEGRKDG